MKKTLSTSDMARTLLADDYADWSWEGATTLLEYLQEIDDSTGMETEFDPIAIRCDFTEYASAAECVQDIASSDFEDLTKELQDEYSDNEQVDYDELESICLAYLEHRTTVLKFVGGIIIQDY